MVIVIVSMRSYGFHSDTVDGIKQAIQISALHNKEEYCPSKNVSQNLWLKLF